MTRMGMHGMGRRAGAWLRGMRLQFYPMTWLAYTLGAVAAPGADPLELAVYWAGFVILVLLEMATVFTNELVDYDTDRRNRNAGPFNGGSRVLVDGVLTGHALAAGAALATAGALFALVALMASLPRASAVAVAAVVLGFGAMALGYTLPPLKLAYRGRGLGEFTVAATHSTGPMLLGYALQGGSLWAPAPWLLSLPLLLGILPSITLAGIPDSPADGSVRKQTLAVRHGPGRAAVAAMVMTMAAALAAGLVALLIGPVYGAGGVLVLAHAVALTGLLERYRRSGAPATRIDGLMVASLTYLFWFAVLPLLVLTG